MSMRAGHSLGRTLILRMWAEGDLARAPVWRFSVEDVFTRGRQGFADLDALICYLLEVMDERADLAVTLGHAEEEIVDDTAADSEDVEAGEK
jgi:hypothetical protein